MSSRYRHYAVILLFALPVMFTHLGGARLWDRDEPRNAGCAVEMLARGDWITPVFNAELRTHKPVLLYWLIMSAYSVLGVNEFATRLPSACLAVGTALCTYEMARRLFSASAGMWAGLIISTSILFVMAGRAATPDATLIFFSTLAVTAYVLTAIPPTATIEPTGKSSGISGLVLSHGYDLPKWWCAALVYASMGMAVLAKGPVGLVLPTAVIGMFLLIMRLAPLGSEPAPLPRWRRWLLPTRVFGPRHFLKTCWSMRPVTAMAICLAIAAPWYLYVGWRTNGEFLRGFFWEHNVSRALATMEGHRGNVLFYPVAILVGFFPWSVFAVPLGIDAVARLRRNDSWKPGYVLGICWVGIYVFTFSLAKTKLPSYVTPCYPALAMLAGAHIDQWLRGVSFVPRAWHYVALSVWTFVGAVLIVALPLVAHTLLPGDEWLGLIGLVPLVGGILCLLWVRNGLTRRAAWTFAGGSAALVVLLFALATDRADRHQFQNRFWTVIHARSVTPRIAAFDCLEPSWVFYGGQPVEQITQESIGPTHSPWIYEHGRWVPKPPVDVKDFLNGPGDPFVITTGRQLENVQRLLPPDFQVLEKIPYFLKKDQLVLLGREVRVGKRVGETEERRD